jgi:hypothetical protein
MEGPILIRILETANPIKINRHRRYFIIDFYIKLWYLFFILISE